MGLSDLDEDEPVPRLPRPAVLISQPPPPPPQPVITTGSATTTPVSLMTKFNQNSTSSNASVLDDLFSSINASAPSSAAGASAPSMYFSSTSSATQNVTPTAAAATASSVLNDLFSGPDVASSERSDKYGSAGETHAMIYVDGNSGRVEDGVNNLFDLSRPVKKDKYNNAESLLEAFERQGKKSGSGGGRPDERETLANLTRNKDDNKVRARLLPLMNYYDVLGVAPTASEEEIKRSYKKKALQLHPDRAGRDQTQEEAELFKVITKANEVLTDAEQRRMYDASLASGAVQAAMAPSAADWWSHMQS